MARQAGMRSPVPVTMLSGFLGSGKTTLLRHLLQQNEQRIACVVNDVASINIDAKLIRNDRSINGRQYTSTQDLTDTIELENGCACCSIQDELFMSFEQLLSLADRKGVQYDRFVLENSGVAEPQNLRDAFSEAVLEGHPVMSRIYLDNMVTIVDSGTFILDYSSCSALAARPDLGEGGTLRPVVDLLVEQIECADFVLLNKIDTVTPQQTETLKAIVRQLNPVAKVDACEHGRVDIQEVFGPEAKGLVAQLNTEGQHRSAVAAARRAAAALELQQKAENPKDTKHEHSHDGHHNHEDHHKHSSHDHGPHNPKESGHADGHHSHGHADGHHSHDHAHKHDHSHDHSHDHHDDCSHGHHEGCGHDHSHDDSHDHNHDHDHGHTHERQTTTAATRFGIYSFVYSRRRPFHPQRLRELVLKWLPVANNSALDGGVQGEGDSPIKSVLRSKGFMWMSNSHSSAYYWSHAGQHFDIRDEGDWWAIVPDNDWPREAGQRRVILSDFDIDSEFGDRRQEIVFIGAGMDEAAICAKMDAALLTDDEMEAYKQRYAAMKDPEHPEIKAIIEQRKKQKVDA